MSKRNIVIITTAILAVIIGLGSVLLYKNINDTKALGEFNEYVEGYKVEMKNYLLSQQNIKYDEILGKSDKLITNKEVEKINNLKQEFEVLKVEIIKYNLDLINTSITELEVLNISEIEDKNFIKEKIEEIKKLRDDNNFITANEAAVGLKDDINKKLQAIKLEEERKQEEEAKRLEEEKRKEKEFDVYTALHYLLTSESLSYLKDIEYIEGGNPELPTKDLYITNFEFKDTKSKTTTTICFFDAKSNFPIYTNEKPNHKYYKIYVEVSHPIIGVNGADEGLGILRFEGERGIIYDNGLYQNS